MNSLLDRQLRRFGCDANRAPKDWGAFLAAISDAYDQAIKDQDLLERSLQIASNELMERNALMQNQVRDHQRMESELRLAQKLESVGQLASGIAHEINTPIQYVGDSVTFLRSAFDDLLALSRTARDVGAELQASEATSAIAARIAEACLAADLEYLEAQVPPAFGRVQDGIAHVASIVRAMKEFAHPDQREMTHTDINHSVRNTLMVSTNEHKYYADVVTDLGTLPEVLCHTGEINQVLLNLVVNAAHAIADRLKLDGTRGHIGVKTRRDDDEVVIWVADDGCGIPEEVRGRVFDPFFTTKEVGRGTGQGLALARAIVDKHHGRISFETEVGAGTTFEVRIPLTQPVRPEPAQ